MNALFNALYFPKSVHTLTQFIFAINVQKNCDRDYWHTELIVSSLVSDRRNHHQYSLHLPIKDGQAELPGGLMKY